jgi:hypothetical protein
MRQDSDQRSLVLREESLPGIAPQVSGVGQLWMALIPSVPLRDINPIKAG